MFRRVVELLRSENILVVGGAVRDRLLKRDTQDYDLVTEKDPASLAQNLAQTLGGTAFALDAERAITRVAVQNGFHVDLAKRQGSSVEEDIDRRDFAINALAVPLNDWTSPQWKRRIIDRHGGLADLKRRRIVPILPAIFDDDPLRILRAFRIAAELDFKIAPETARLIKKKKHLVLKPAAERIREELLKIFSTTRSYATLVSLEELGILERLLPVVNALRRTAPRYYGKGGVLKHTLDSLELLEKVFANLDAWFPGFRKPIHAYLQESLGGHPRAAHLKWGILLHDIGKPATAKVIKGRLRFFEHEHVGANMVARLAARFRWSSEEAARYARLVRNHMRPGNLAAHEPQVTDRAIHRFFRDLGEDAVGMLLVALADHLSYVTPSERGKHRSGHERMTKKMIRRFYHRRNRILPPKIINGHDVMKAFNLPPSPLIGELLSDLQEAQAGGKIHSKEDALAYLRGRVASHVK